jgi:hypothetical protein
LSLFDDIRSTIANSAVYPIYTQGWNRLETFESEQA